MSLALAQIIVGFVSAYLGIGLLFAVPFAFVGAQRIDPAARGSTWGFRLIIIPGICALWPLLAWRWLRGRAEPPAERNAHRAAARGGSR